MNRRTFLRFAGVLVAGTFTPALRASDLGDVERLRPILRALRERESGGEPNGGRGARGDRCPKTGVYRALGPYQIWRVYHTDSGVAGPWERCLHDAEYSERVILAYMLRYERRAVEIRYWEPIARAHNGGPGWAREPARTDAYWQGVRRIMERNGDL